MSTRDAVVVSGLERRQVSRAHRLVWLQECSVKVEGQCPKSHRSTVHGGPAITKLPAMPPERPPMWKQVFDKLEAAVAPHLEAAVRTEQFADGAATITKLQSEAKKRAAKASQQAMHFWNIPTARDISRLLEHVTDLERKVRSLTVELDEANARAQAPEAPAARRPRSPRGQAATTVTKAPAKKASVKSSTARPSARKKV